MILHKISDQPSSPDEIGVAINDGRFHVGILFRGEDGTVKICDLQRDHVLRVGNPPPEYFWVKAKLEPREVGQVSALVRLVIKKNPTGFPYSFVYIKRALMASGGLKGGVAGLTCVTFIVAIFEALSLPVVDTKTWKSRAEDGEFRSNLLTAWGNQGADLSQIAKLYGETIPFRIKPLEIFGATSAEKYPVAFEEAKLLADEAAQCIKNYKGPNNPATVASSPPGP